MKNRYLLALFAALAFGTLGAANCTVIFQDPFGSVLKTAVVTENTSAVAQAPSAPSGTTISGWSPMLGIVTSNTVYTCAMTGGEGYRGSKGTKVTDAAILARGGDAVYKFTGTDGTEYVHLYTNTASAKTFVNNSACNLLVRYLVVGGGGAGGCGEWKAAAGGGGGGGIVLGGEEYLAKNTGWSVRVGAGGVAKGAAASASSLGTAAGLADIARALGGGAGGTTTSYPTALGTGGGGAGDSIQGKPSKAAGALGTANSECDGVFYPKTAGADALSAVVSNGLSFCVLAGGGAGAGASAPAPSAAEFRAGNGGSGVYSSITGELRVYGVGGGAGGGLCYEFPWKLSVFAGHPDGLLPGIGAYGVGAGGLGTARVPDGGYVKTPSQATSGADGYGCGGGAGGAGSSSTGANGGSGVVILRYFEREAEAKPAPEPAPLHVASSPAVEDFLRPTRSAQEPLVITLDPSFVKFDKNDGAAGFSGIYSNQIQNAVRAGRPVNVVFRNGTYNMPIYKNWDFPADLSGTPEAPVTFKAETPGQVRFLGDTALDKSGFAKITSGDRWYSRLASKIPAAALSKIVVANIPDKKIYIPADTTLNCGENAPSTQLYLDGRIQECARWPNRMANGCAGWTNYVSCLDNSDVNAVKIRLPAGRASRWADLTSPTNGVFLHGSFKEPWTDEFIRVKRIENGTDVTFATKMQAMPEVGSANQIQRFAAVNALEELDAPGEWWLDKLNKRLYYYPEEDDFLTSSSELYLVSNRDMLIDFQGPVHDVRFEGIEFAYSGSICAASSFLARRIEFADCNFHSFRKDAVIAGVDIAFRRCRFEHFCGGMIQFRRSTDETYAERKTLTATRDLCEDCEFSDFQHVKVSGTRAIQAYLTGSAVRNCSFDGGGHSAIIFRGNEIFMGWCRSVNCLRETIDASVFYTGRDTTYLGNVILGCDFRDSKPLAGSYIKPEADDKRACALYLDDGVWGGDFIGCTVDNLRQGLWLRGGNMHTFAWNRFSNCGLGIKLDASCAPERNEINAFLDGKTRETWHLGYVTKYGIELDSLRWRAAYPGYRETITDATNRYYPWNNLMLGNVLSDCDRFYDGTADDYGPSMTFTNNFVIGHDGYFSGHAGFGRLAVNASPREAPGMEAALARIAALSNATPVEAYSPKGRARVRFLPDVTARLCVRVELEGRDFLWPSETGLTVGGVDYGRMVRPVNAATVTAANGDYTSLTFDLECVLDGSRAASVEAQIYDNGIRYRYRVQGAAVASAPSFTGWRVAEGVTAVTAGETDESVSYSSGRVVGAWRTVSTDGTLAPYEDPLVEIAAPAARIGLEYTGKEQTGVKAGTGYLVIGNTGTAAGDYLATVTLLDGYCWTGGGTAAKTIPWSIAKKRLSFLVSISPHAIEAGDPRPAMSVIVSGFVNGETSATAADYTAPTISCRYDPDDPENCGPGHYFVSAVGAAARDYSFPSTNGILVVTDPSLNVLTTNILDNAWGYEIQGLGAESNAVALVFTNTTLTMNWTVPTNVTKVEYMLIGGGASGGHARNAHGAGGGGAGAVYTGERAVTKGTALEIKVGAGGASAKASGTGSANGKVGFDSSLKIGSALFLASGGGGGGVAGAGNVGGSGGGAGCKATGTDPYSGGAGTKNGGCGGDAAGGTTYRGAGGGGAREDGCDYNVENGRGGAGIESRITGTKLWYAGGGGGSGTSAGYGRGGAGGGGAGSHYATTATASILASEAKDGSAFGAGGGGASNGKSTKSGAGHAGAVIIRYTRAKLSAVPTHADIPRIHCDYGEAVALFGERIGISIENADPSYRYGYLKAATIEGLKTATPVYPAAQPVSGGAWTLEAVRNLDEPSAFYQLIVVPW